MNSFGRAATMIVVFLAVLASAEATFGDATRLSTVAGVATWLVTNVAPVAAGFALLELALVVGDLVSTRAGARLDRQLYALLGAAVRRVPARRRSGYLREWEGELHEILHGVAARPVTRVWRGLRFVVGIRRAATAIGRTWASASAPEPVDRRSRGVVRRLGKAGADVAVALALTPVVTVVFVLLAVLVGSGLAAVAVWAAGLAIARAVGGGADPRTTFPRAFTTGCRAVGLSWFGWPVASPTSERKVLSFGRFADD